MKKMVQFILLAACLFGVAFQNGESVERYEDEPSDVLAYPDGRSVNISHVVRNAVMRGTPEILDGAGYSEDLHRIVHQRCFKVKVLGTTDQQAIIQTTEQSSFSSLKNEIGGEIGGGLGFDFFSLSAKASYLRSVQDDEYSLSFNYYQYASNEVTLQIDGYGENALNPNGQQIWWHNNNRFGIVCGDNYLSSFRQGALLLMGLAIKFNSAEDKHAFSAGLGIGLTGFISLGNIVSGTAKIETAAKSKQISGQVSVHAYQLGGEPSQLSKIFSGDEKTPFYLTSCSITAMGDCKKAAEGLLHYAADNFSQQYSFEKNFGLASFGAAFSTYGSIKNLGLTPPPSLVTPAIKKYRFQLAEKLRECDAIINRLDRFLGGKSYNPKHANLVDNLNAIRSRAEENCNLLRQPHGGSGECFDRPDECLPKWKPIFDSQLHNFTLIDILFLENDEQLDELLSSDSFTKAVRNEEAIHALHRFDN